MALIKCSECGCEVSDKATSCPNCGCPIEEIRITKEAEKSKKTKGFIIIIGIIATLLILFFLVVKNNNTKVMDCSAEIGSNGLEMNGATWEADEAYSIMFPENEEQILTYKKDTDIEGCNGKLEYRCYDSEYEDYNAYEIFYVGWESEKNENAEAIIDEEGCDKLIKSYDKLYGEHTQDEMDYTNGTRYTWKLSDNKKFDITVYGDYSYFALKWVYNDLS